MIDIFLDVAIDTDAAICLSVLQEKTSVSIFFFMSKYISDLDYIRPKNQAAVAELLEFCQEAIDYANEMAENYVLREQAGYSRSKLSNYAKRMRHTLDNMIARIETIAKEDIYPKLNKDEAGRLQDILFDVAIDINEVRDIDLE